jgi:hypothetical protein
MSISNPSQYWRWIFIVSEAILATSFVIGVLLAPHLGWHGTFGPPALARVHAVLVALAWLFLLLASPFFLRSLRGVALAGLILALCVLGYFAVTFG